MSRGRSAWVASAALLTLLGRGALVAQTAASPPNGFTPRDDVEIGINAAALVAHRLPVLHDEAVTRYLTGVLRRLVVALPSELQHSEFRYAVQVIDVREVNARALPGGPIFVNRGLIESARSPGELAGVIAHELGHIALRHGTAQATRVTEFTVAALTRALVATLEEAGTRVVQAGHEPIDEATAPDRMAPEYERQADALGVLVMARAGYDPNDMAGLLRAIARADGTWFVDRGESERRCAAILHEAASLRVDHPVRDMPAFERARARLRAMAPAPTTAAALGTSRRRDAMPSLDPERPGRIAPTSARFTTYTERNLFQVRVPCNWRALPDGTAVVFAPRGAYGDAGGQTVFTHGVEIGLVPRDSDDLRSATDALIALLASDNPNLRRLSDDDRVRLANRPALRTVMSNVSDVTGREERMEIVTALLGDGRLFYALVVAPRDEFDRYDPTFRQVVSSIAMIEQTRGDVPARRAGRRRAPVQSGAARSQTFLPHSSTDEVP
jgi:beta-barrel assembly-enhancing protease